ncbi:MAG: NAD(P) transhydrogenase subunit alpha [Acidobacteria bacterium]|jgi:H+-translocating NAD(P) transhydrogenase subunit alpha|nr:NAD(P) transhydrogenase subunit alpha [Acidobacteriota bacterium]
MSDLLIMLAVLIGSFGAGYALISKVPTMLHTPLMSMTNAISAVTILGALLLFASETSPTGKLIGMVALLAAAFNVVGGFVMTDRMLKLFKHPPRRGTGE